MEYYRINANELDEEELNYELALRGHPTDGPPNTRQRTLRNLLRESEEYFANVMQVCSQTIANDFALIPHRLREIEQKLRNGPAPECLSRLVHYHKRVRRYVSVSVMEHENKKELLELISNLANRYFRIDLNFLAGYVPVNRLTGTSNSAYQSLTDAAVGNQSSNTLGNAVNETRFDETAHGSRFLGNYPKDKSSQQMDPVNVANPFLLTEQTASVIPDRGSDLIDLDPRVDFALQTSSGTAQSVPVVRSPEVFDQPRGSVVTAPDNSNWRPSAQSNAYSNFENASQTVPLNLRGHNPINHPSVGTFQNTRTEQPDAIPEPQADSTSYIHVSQIENYVKTCVSQVLTQLQQSRSVRVEPQEVTMDNLAKEFANVNLQNHSTAYTPLERQAPRINQPTPPLQLKSHDLLGQPGFRIPNEGNYERSSGHDARVSTPRLHPEVPLNSQFSPVVGFNNQPLMGRRSESHPMDSTRPPVSGSVGIARTPRNENGPPASFGCGLPMRRLPHQQCNIIEKWPKFTGESNSVPVIDFLRQIEMLCRSYGIEKEDLRIHAHLLFRDDAYVWYTTYEERFHNWDTLVFHLKMRYDNPNRDRLLREEMRNRKQRPNERFSAFLTEMETLAKRMMKPMAETEKYDIIIENMKVSYKRRLALEPIHSLEHLAQLCYKFDALESTLYNPKSPVKPGTLNHLDIDEEQSLPCEEATEEELFAFKAKPSRPGTGQRIHSNRQVVEKPYDGVESNAISVLCWNCRRTGHMWRDCDKRKTIFCHICGQADTTAFRCPNQHNLPSKEESESKNE